MTDHWVQELKSMPFTSRKNGKMLNLLKASSKPINKNKKRKTIPLFGSIKDYHASKQHNQGSSLAGASQQNSQASHQIPNNAAGSNDDIEVDGLDGQQEDFNI